MVRWEIQFVLCKICCVDLLSDGCTVMCLAMFSVGVKLEVTLVSVRCLVYEKTRAVECCSIAEQMKESGKWKVFKNEEAREHHMMFPLCV